MSETTVHVPLPGPSIDVPLHPVVRRSDLTLCALLNWTPTATGFRLPRGWEATLTTSGVNMSRAERLLSVLDEINAKIDAVIEENEAELSSEPGPRELALGAVESLRRWLGMTDEQVAELAGIAPRSVPNWRNKGQQPYASTVRHLFEIHNLVAALVRRLGLHEALVWLAEGEGGASRIDQLRSHGFDAVASEAVRLLFPPPPRRYTQEDWNDDDTEPQEPKRDPELFRGHSIGKRNRQAQA